jgi:hypothetical protein
VRKIAQSELADILKKHEMWLREEIGGEQANLSEVNLRLANLSEVNLSQANLSGANLVGANLIGANLSWANLSGANLSDANLSEVNLSQANLSEANLSMANLWGANLSEANLSEANLWGANLSEANLSEANLWGANGTYSMQLSAHTIVVWFDRESSEYIVKVGCKEYSIDHWLERYESIGRRNDYSELQCEEYGIQLQAIKRLISLWTTGESK